MSAQNPGFTELVTVLRPATSHELLLAKSLLESAGIKFFVKGEALQKLNPGMLCGFGIFSVEIQVPKEDAPAASQLLQELYQGE